MLRFNSILLAVAVFAIVTLMMMSLVSAEDFAPDRFHLADHNPQTNAFLFRSNEPTWVPPGGKRTFAYDQVFAAMQNQTKTLTPNATFPTNKADVYIIDVALNTIFETGVAENEEFFAKNPKAGKWINWVTVGDILHPSEVSAQERNELILNGTIFKVDHLPERLIKLREMLAQGPPAGYSALGIVVHCAAGCDRTGEFFTSYALQFAPRFTNGRWTNFTGLYAQEATQQYGCGRAGNWFSTGAQAWYCLYFNIFNASQYGVRPLPDCMSAYRCKFLKACEPVA